MLYHIWCTLMLSVLPYAGVFGFIAALGLGASLSATGITLVVYITIIGCIDQLVEYYHRRQ